QRLGRTADAAQVNARLKIIEKDMRELHEIVTVRRTNAPDDPDLHVQAGQIMLRAGETREGLRWLQQALKLDPRYPRAHQVLADYFESIGDTRLALRHRQLAGLPPAH